MLDVKFLNNFGYPFFQVDPNKSCWYFWCVVLCTYYLVNTRMRSKRDIKMGRLCTPGGAVLGIVGGGVTFRFLNGEAILDENMLFWVRLYALVAVLKILLDFRL